MKIAIVLFALVLFAAVSISEAAHARGIARVRGTLNMPGADGWLTITQDPTNDDNSTIEWEFWGLPANSTHGVHIHEYGDVTGDSGLRTGGHYNPMSSDHGCYPNARHYGDVMNITTDENGYSNGSIVRDLVYARGDYSTIGRAVIVHADPDTCGQPTGNAGSRYMQGTIGIQNDVDNGGYQMMNNAVYTARLHGTTSYPNVMGNVHFYRYEDGVSDTMMLMVRANFSGLPGSDGDMYGLHIHEFGDVSSDDGLMTGGHWNPTNENHGCFNMSLPDGGETHQGDIGNIVQDAMGYSMFSTTIYLRFNWDNVTDADEAMAGIAGRGVVLHALMDDCMGSTGNAGGRMSAGVIGLPSDDYFPYEWFESMMSSSSSMMMSSSSSPSGVDSADMGSPTAIILALLCLFAVAFLN
jgi:Cu-Zn family superoxide dismutase